MVEELKNSISKDFNGICFNLEDWDAVLRDTSQVTVFHLISTIEYYVEYFNAENLSFVLYDNNRAVGVFPLFVYKNNDNWLISGNDMGLIKPLFVNSIAKKVKKRLEKKIANIVYFISHSYEIKKIKLFDTDIKLSSWYLLWLDSIDSVSIKHQMAIDLNQSIDNIKLGFRKSYRPLIGKAFREWDIDVYESNIDDIFEEFRLLHKAVAGRETRTIKTWNIQKNQIINNEAFLITVRDKGILIGAGFFNYTKDMGRYSVGAYNRELFDNPIGHGVQMKAIQVLKEKGCKLYFIGQKVTPIDKIKPTAKELSISYFKEGFASYVFLEPHMELSINE